MTRAQWIQRKVLLFSMSTRATEEDGREAIECVVKLANALEKSGAAPWDDNVPQGYITQEAARQFARDEIDEEREACAKIADRNDKSPWGIAREIRDRGIT